jgi:hypothetical protein
MITGREIKYYRTKAERLTGARYLEVERQARKSYNTIARRTKRNAYVRSKYFKKDKIFVKLFWEHLNQKSQFDRKRRLKYYDCAIDLLRNTTLSPDTRQNPNGRDELVHRFAGKTDSGEVFYVQVKENNRTGNKHFISVFPGK